MNKTFLHRIKIIQAATGFNIEDNYIDHGTQGIIFRKNQSVVKVSNDVEEAKIAEWAQINPHPYLPVIEEVICFPKNIRAIVREPLEDLEQIGDLDAWLTHVIKTVRPNNKQVSYSTQILNSIGDFSSLYIREIVDILTWLDEQRFLVRELFSFNFGRRGSQVVVRDLGMLRVNPRRTINLAKQP